jgi:MFS family permease
MLVGFGAILPILPLYLVSHGIDNAMLGVIIAAWPLAKLISEPIFGYLADRRARKPIMLIALVILAVSIVMPLWLTSAPAFFVGRLIGGVATGMYDPAARGIIVDATDEDRRG